MAEIITQDGSVILIDDDYLPIASQYKWKRDRWGHVYRRKRNAYIYLHREIMNAPPKQKVDHRDGVITDNRRENLRFCDDAQNSQNRRKGPRKTASAYKGLILINGKWQARITAQGKTSFLGTYKDEMEAAHAYNKAAVRLHGEFACLNPIGVDYE